MDKVKPYQTSSKSNAQDSYLQRMDSILDKLIRVEVFMFPVRKGLAKAQTATCISTTEVMSTRNDVLVTEIIEPGDKRNISEIFHKSKKAEIEGLIERRTWTVVDMKSLPPNSNVIDG